MRTSTLCNIGQYTALATFLIGTIIFIIFHWTSGSEIVFVGVIYIYVAAFFNIILLVKIFRRMIADKPLRKKLHKTAMIISLNIPAMVIYLWLSMLLMGTMRITFINETQYPLTDIKLVGCGGGYINELEVGESKTVWIRIPRECSLSINYLENGQRKTEVVSGYIPATSGHKAKHRINGKDKELFL